jgi:hypothetical protein
MKSIYLPIFILTWALVLSGMWIIRPGSTDSTLLEYIYVGAIVCFFILSNVFWFTRIKRIRKKLPTDDELSKMVDQKSAGLAYYSSIILWLILILLQLIYAVEVKWIIAFGMIGMAFSYVICWIIIYEKTYRYEK